MRVIGKLFLSAFLVMSFVNGTLAQEQVQIERPITEVRSALAISYPEGTTISLKFKGTERLPKSTGEAKVERKKGTTEIEIELDEMKPASYFGGDYSTYVLWVVSPEGHTDNVGEFILEGNRSKLNVSTPLETFGLFVTAEPHFLVDVPSRFVAMENTRPTNKLTGQILEVSNIKYRGFDGIYKSSQSTLENSREVKGEVRSDVKQARVALALAERAGAREFATEEFEKALESWERTAAAAEARTDKKILMTLGHETVRLAVEAEKRAKERVFQAALDAERQENADEIGSLKNSIERAESEAERSQLLAKQKEMELRIEQDARAAALAKANESARRAAEAEEKALLAQQQALLAQQQARDAATAKQKAEMNADLSAQEAEKARIERDAVRARLRNTLSMVVETRESARGIILNLPDILFDFNKATLKPQAKEILSKISGILMVADGFSLSIEGHTDSVGSEEYNQKLSELRAESVMKYLISAGLRDNVLTSSGYGETSPVSENTNAEGRQRNRRVEIVIADTQARNRLD